MPKKSPKKYRVWLFIFYQIVLVFAIIVAAIATYTAVKNGIIGKSESGYSITYRSETGCPTTSNFIEETARTASSGGAASAAIMWAIVIVLAGLWYQNFKLFKTDNESEIIKLNHPILISLIVLCVVTAAVFGYDCASTSWIEYYHFSMPGDAKWVSYASLFDGGTLATKDGISFANIWNCSVAYTFFSGATFVCLVPAIVFSAKTYNNWRITA